MGIPETILYTSAESADRMYQTAYLCEPPPDEDSIAVANMLIQAIPAVADVEGEAAQEKLRRLAYRLSRALIGEDLARSFHFPPRVWWDRATLFKYRTKQRFLRTLAGSQKVRAHNCTQLFQISVYDEDGVSYRRPGHVKTARQTPW